MVVIFDIGGTKMRLALYEHGKMSTIHRFETDRSTAGFAKFLDAIETLSAGKNVSAVIGGMVGQLRGDAGELTIASNLPNWLGIPVLARIKEIMNCPVFVANDVELCGLGESRYGAGTTNGVMVYYTISTGVNAVRIVGGIVDHTISRYELGHQIINYGDGGFQTLESQIGGAAIAKRFEQQPRDIKDPAVWNEIAHFLAAGLYNTVLYWDPAVVVFGGSMMRDINLAVVAERLATLPAMFECVPKLVTARLGDESGLFGAMAWSDILGYK